MLSIPRHFHGLLFGHSSFYFGKRLSLPALSSTRYAAVIGLTMFMTTGIAVIFIVGKLLIGCLVGLLIAALIYRSRLNTRLGVRSALIAGVTYLLFSGLAGWADAHAAFQNGHRLAFAPWGEDLRLRNFIAENGLVICLAASAIAATLANVSSIRK
jgi:hypothetical protein